ncbi:MAG: hypothetical protein AAGN82_17925 [Myxococcota bacterium]
MGQKLEVRPYRPSDASRVRALLHTRPELSGAAADRRADVFEWLAEHNPHARDETTYFVAVAPATGDVIAYIGRMPLDATWRGKPVRLYFGHDLYMHPEHRAQGAAGFFTTMKLYREVERSPGPVGLLWTSALNLEFQRRRNYVEVESLRLVKVLDPVGRWAPQWRGRAARWSKQWVRRGWRSLEGGAARLRAAGLAIRPVTRFDERFDRLAERIAPTSPLVVKRDAAYLNWKYIDRPHHPFVSFAVTQGDTLRGFVTLLETEGERGADEPEGTIADYAVAPGDGAALNALCHHATLYFLRRKKVRIHALATDPALVDQFNRNLFLSRPDDPLMVIHPEQGPPGASLDTRAGWQLTFGDSDGLCFWGLGLARD